MCPIICIMPLSISIHALLAESDLVVTAFPGSADNFYPRSPCGERPLICPPHGIVLHISIHALLAESDFCLGSRVSGIVYFYPRSPCGERRRGCAFYYPIFAISIHALLAESDGMTRPPRRNRPISIHALLAESDAPGRAPGQKHKNFYPRSPCGERRSVSG